MGETPISDTNRENIIICANLFWLVVTFGIHFDITMDIMNFGPKSRYFE